MFDNYFQGKTILVTGGAGGIGESIVRSYDKLGARVFLHYNSSTEKASTMQKSLKNCSLVQADLREEKAVSEMFKSLPALDHVIANAGIYESQSAPIHEMTLDQWNHTLNSNLTSIFLITKYFFQNIQHHQTTAPSLIMIGSTAGIFGERGHADYAASKAPLTSGLLYSLKNEITKLAPLGRVNCVAPGWTVTPMAQDFLDNKEAVKKTMQTLSLQKLATGQDVANAVLYLTSPLAGHVTGETIRVTGGMEGRVIWEKEEISL